MLRHCPRVTNGGSTGHLPTQVKRITTETNIQNKIFLYIIKLDLFIILDDNNGINISIAIDMINIITPPNLLGTDRKIA